MPATITNDRVRQLAAGLEGAPFVEEYNFAGCSLYDGGVRCGQEVVETLVPIYGDHDPYVVASVLDGVAVCVRHLREHLSDQLLSAL